MLSKVFNGMSLEELQGFITEQEKLVIRAETEWEDSPVVRELGGCLDNSLSGKKRHDHGKSGTRGYNVRSSIQVQTGCYLVYVSKLLWAQRLAQREFKAH